MTSRRHPRGTRARKPETVLRLLARFADDLACVMGKDFVHPTGAGCRRGKFKELLAELRASLPRRDTKGKGKR